MCNGPDVFPTQKKSFSEAKFISVPLRATWGYSAIEEETSRDVFPSLFLQKSIPAVLILKHSTSEMR